MTPKRLAITLVLIVAAGGIGYTLFGHGKNDKNKNALPTVNVTVADVVTRDMPLQIEVAGNVVPTQTVAIKSRIDSQIMEVRFKDGDSVKAGDVLFVLDPRVLQSQLAQLQANLAREKSTAEDLRLKYMRSKDLRGKGYETAANFDTAKIGYEAQLANVKTTEAAVESAEVQLEYTTIASPISGRAGTINLTVGNNVKANDTTPLVTINEISPISARAAIPQTALIKLRDAMSVAMPTVEAIRADDKTPIPGMLTYVDNQIDQTTGTVMVRAEFPNKDEKLWPGMFVNLVIVIGADKDAVVVPEMAVQHGQNSDYVFTVVDGKAVKKDVQLSRVQDGMAVVASGLGAGDKAVVDGMMTLRDGMAVNVQVPKTADTEKTAPEKSE